MSIPPLGFSSGMATLQDNQDKVEKAIQNQDGKHSPPSKHKPWTIFQSGGLWVERPPHQHGHNDCEPLTGSPPPSPTLGIDNPATSGAKKATSD